MHAGAVKDSVVGEERLAQYLLAVLNIRKVPLHWDRLYNQKIKESLDGSSDSKENIFGDGLSRKRNRINRSDVSYIEVLNNFFVKSSHHLLCL